MSTILRLFVFLGLIVLTLSAEEPSRYIKQFENTYRRASTLRTTFLEQYSESGRVLRAETGVAYFHRPGKMRWEYEAPEKNLFLVDGKSAWFYVPADHTVTRVPAKQSTDWRTPLALLAGEVRLSRICARVELLANAEKPEKNGDVVLSCLLKGSTSNVGHTTGNDAAETNRDVLLLEVTPETSQLVRAVVRGRGGVDIEFKFKDWQFDPPLPDSFFRFDVPPGVAIVNGELPASDSKVNP